MERAHRIGQEKPVRVYRLVCGGSVEERIVSRAEKKLFLNAMVAEAEADADAEQEVGEEGAEDTDGHKSISQALGISGGASISKGELASLIRFGANAVFGNDGGEGDSSHVSDAQLALLLERQGRDVAAPAVDAQECADVPAKGDEIGRHQSALHDRMNKLKEVDLRQLGGDVFPSKLAQEKASKKKKKRLLDSSEECLPAKRVRKERITMVDGKGTGYGGAVPVLSASIEDESADAAAKDEGDQRIGGRGRNWEHMEFCAVCGKHPLKHYPGPEDDRVGGKGKGGKGKGGKGKKKDKGGTTPKRGEQAGASADHSPSQQMDALTLPIRCTHCPFIFHIQCNPYNLNNNSTRRPAGMFICPHHRCMVCDRSTVSAGGLLFRCVDCFASYCEDCLPQDDIDSIGRCRELLAQGYDSKQAYYIRCPCCLSTRGYKATGLLGSTNNDARIPRVESTVSMRSTGSIRSSVADPDAENEIEEEDNMVQLALQEADRSGVADDQGVSSNKDEDDGGEVDGILNPLPFQLLKIHWKEVPPPEPSPSPSDDERGGGASSSKKGKGAKKKGEKAVKKAKVKDESEKSSALDDERPSDGLGDDSAGEDVLSPVVAVYREMQARIAATGGSWLADATCTSDEARRPKKKQRTAPQQAKPEFSLRDAIDKLQGLPLLRALFKLKQHLEHPDIYPVLDLTDREALDNYIIDAFVMVLQKIETGTIFI